MSWQSVITLWRKIIYNASSESINWKTVIVGLILLGGLIVRLWGVGYGLPYIYHPDENRQILDSLGMAQRRSILPEDLSYPALHKYLILLVSAVYFSVGKVMGWFSSPSDFAVRFFTFETNIFLLSRLLSVVGGMVVGVVVYKMGKRLWGYLAGIIGLLLSMFMFHLIQHSQWAIADIFLALFTTLSFYYIILSTKGGENLRELNLACLFVGLAISTKPQGLFLLIPLMLSQIFVLTDGLKTGMTDFIRKRLPSVMILFFASLFGNLMWIFNFSSAYEKFTMLSQVAQVGISSKKPFETGFFHMVVWFIKDLVRQEELIGIVLVGGILYAIIKRTREDILLLSYLTIYFLSIRNWAIRYLHLFVAFFPLLCVFGGRFLSDIFRTTRVRNAVIVPVLILIIVPSLYDIVRASIKKTNTDTRLMAKMWIEENIKEGTTIAMDWYEFPVPLWGDVPVNLLNPKAQKYFMEKIDKDIREGYHRFLEGRKTYKIVPVIYSTDEPRWPEEMAPDVIKRAQDLEVLRELYSVFNFRTLEELKRLGCQYIIITSYSYTLFLLDTDPNKTPEGVFNYLIKEDMLSFNKQADNYHEDGLFGLLYFLNKRAREFYEPLLHNGGEATLIKEFSPDEDHLGPVIKIYRLK